MHFKTILPILISITQLLGVSASQAGDKIEQINPFTTDDWQMSVRALASGIDVENIISGYRMSATSFANSGLDEFGVRRVKAKIKTDMQEAATQWRSQYSGFEFIVEDFPIFPSNYNFKRKKYWIKGVDGMFGNKVERDGHSSIGYKINFQNKSPMFTKIGCKPEGEERRIVKRHIYAHHLSSCFVVDFKSDEDAEQFNNLSKSEQILYSFKCGYIQYGVSRANNKSFAGVFCDIYDLEIHTATKRNIRRWVWNGKGWDDKAEAYELSATPSAKDKPKDQRVLATLSSHYGATQLMLQNAPTKIADIIYTLIPGDEVEVIAQKNGWAQVKANVSGKTYAGWVDLSVVRVTVH